MSKDKESIKQIFVAEYHKEYPDTVWLKPEFLDDATNLIYSGVQLITDSSIENVEIKEGAFIQASVALIVKYKSCSGYVAEEINEAALSISKGIEIS